MKIEDLNGLKIGIFGYGAEGKSVLNYLLRHNIDSITVYDEKEFGDEDKTNFKNREILFKTIKFEDVSDRLDAIFRSPGIKIERLEKIAGSAALSSATDLFLDNYKGIAVGVTGTKGKSTTVRLIEEILKNAGKVVHSGGNLGNPMLDFVDDTTAESYSLLELSSFQLQDLKRSPDVAIILPILVDHLDYHRDEAEYFKAKTSIFKYMKDGAIVISSDKNDFGSTLLDLNRKCFFFSDSREAMPGCYRSDQQIICRIGDENIFENTVSAASEVKVPLDNVLASLSFALAENLDVDIEKSLRSFQKPKYRLEFVLEKNGIKYFNDGASTNPISAIAGMTTINEPYAIILGGSSKGLDFAELSKKISSDNNLKVVLLNGATGGELDTLIRADGFTGEIIRAETLDEIVPATKKLSGRISVVLFSPACASFDQFKNYLERAERFNQLVREIS